MLAHQEPWLPDTPPYATCQLSTQHHPHRLPSLLRLTGACWSHRSGPASHAPFHPPPTLCLPEVPLTLFFSQVTGHPAAEISASATPLWCRKFSQPLDSAVSQTFLLWPISAALQREARARSGRWARGEGCPTPLWCLNKNISPTFIITLLSKTRSALNCRISPYQLWFLSIRPTDSSPVSQIE